MSQFVKILVSLAIFASFAHSQNNVNFPYPQQKSYGNSTINASNAVSSTLKTRFTSWLGRFYETGNCNNKLNNTPCARIKWYPDNDAQTVSEGIGYGMLLMVYFSDNTTDYQDQFNKLWAYYRNWTNGNELMNWKINGFSSVAETNAATDAELDVAMALAMAHYQFKSSTINYLDAAVSLIRKIRQFEISTNNLLKPGDAWESERNPSYISPAAFEIFREVESDQAAKWKLIIDANYELLVKNQNSNSGSGLFSDWCTDNGIPSRGKYGYDAARTPWRIAWANAWYGHATANELLKNLYSKFLNNKNASSIFGEIELNGTMPANCCKNSTFIGPFTNAFSYSSANQAKMDAFWSELIGFTNEGYYNGSLQLLSGLLASGNMPNLKATTPGGGAPSSSSGGGSASSVQIDQLATATSDDKVFAKTWEPWYAYTDVGNSGSSTMQNTKSKVMAWNKETSKCEETDSYAVIMQDGSDWVAKINNYSLSQGGNTNEPYVALGLEAENNGTAYNFSGCTGGFSYSFKGSAHNFKAQLKTVQDYAYHAAEIGPASTIWKTVTIPTSELIQPSAWGEKVTFNLSNINAFSWELKGGKGSTSGVSANTGSLAIKDFRCIGTMTFPASKPAPKCAAGASSSSKANSSSSVASSSSRANSSSSVASSSSRNTTNIMLSPVASKNEMLPMHNGVSLQVLNNATLEIFNLNGKLFRKMDFASGVHSVQLSDLPKSLYIVRVQFGNRKEVLYVPIK